MWDARFRASARRLIGERFDSRLRLPWSFYIRRGNAPPSQPNIHALYIRGAAWKSGKFTVKR
jgi:hypothetical protein